MYELWKVSLRKGESLLHNGNALDRAIFGAVNYERLIGGVALRAEG
jgi:hypothetical protein